MSFIKCALFDIDGTLINRGQQFINPEVVAAIRTLQAKGIAVVIATGRAYYFILESVRKDLGADFVVTINGGCTLSGDGKVIAQTLMDLDDVNLLVKKSREDGFAIGFKCEDAVYVANDYPRFLKDYLHGFTQSNVLIDYTSHDVFLKDGPKPMGAFAFGDVETLLDLNQQLHETRIVIAHDTAVDIFSTKAGKESALEQVLSSLNTTWEHTIAFGDSANDINMLKKAAIGVAMGNGSDDCKAAADYVTTSVTEDGIVTALKHFDLI